MSQNMQHARGVDTGVRQCVDASDEDSTMQAETLKIISCPICRAVYVPSPRQQAMVRQSADLLETTFLCLCHFCFRCQRPACPQCWSPIHHVCVACGEEAGLPFLMPVPSLEGLILCAPPSARSQRAANQPFTCLRNGRFYAPDAVAHPEPPKADLEAPREYASPARPEQQPAARDNPLPSTSMSTSAYPYPSWLQEVLGRKADNPSSEPLAFEAGRSISAQVAPISARPVQTLAPTSPHTSQPNWAAVAYAVPQFAEFPPLLTNETSQEAEEREDGPGEESPSVFERIENVLLFITSTLLLAIVCMIVLAVISADMNTFFLHLIHVDIRNEISYLLQLR
jgi:hypothetical protein